MLSAPQEYILTSTQEINLFLAGIGSGKTHLGGLVSAFYVQNFPEASGFIGANTYNQLNTSTMLRIREVWKHQFGWNEGRDYVVGKKPPEGFKTERHNFDRYDGICSFRGGAIVFLGSLDNAKAHDGKEFAWAILDETKDTRETDVKEVILGRLRQTAFGFDEKYKLIATAEGGFNPMYVLTSPAKVQWLNEWFGLDDDRAEIEGSIYSKDRFFAKERKGKCIAISSTFHNEANLPPGYIQRILDNNADERGKALIYGNPFTKTGGEFYSSFSAARHVGRVEFIPDLPVHVTFDQNVVPYITAGLWQVDTSGEHPTLRKFAEFCLPNPNNTTERLCQAIVARYGDKMRSLFYYGDASGHHRDTRGNGTDYEIAARTLRRWLNNGSDRTDRRNPPVLQRRDFINNVLEGKTRWRVVIDESCKNTVVDLTYLKQDPNGLKWKEKGKDEVSGQTFEKYGHCFSGGTMITTRRGQVRIDEVLPGDFVLTRTGFKKVLQRFDNGLREVADYELNGIEITCTKDHRFYTQDVDFVEVECLKIGQTICIFDQNTNQICKTKLLSFRGSGLQDTRTRKGRATSGILPDGSFGMASEKKSGFIVLCGCVIMAMFQKVITFITKTATRLTIPLKTWSASKALTIFPFTEKTSRQIGLFREKDSWMKWQGQRRRNGISQKQGGKRAGKSCSTFWKIESGNLTVWSAESALLVAEQMMSFAQNNVARDITPENTGLREHITNGELVLLAERVFWPINGTKPATAQGLVALNTERVYDLEVEGQHEYFANGILVHNCSDGDDYFFCKVAENDFERFCSQT